MVEISCTDEYMYSDVHHNLFITLLLGSITKTMLVIPEENCIDYNLY